MVAWKEAIEASAKQMNALSDFKKEIREEHKEESKEEHKTVDLGKHTSSQDPALRFGLSEQKEGDCAILKSYFNFGVPNVKIVLFADKQELDSSKGVFD